MPDWPSIKMEYISTQISTRELAKKYGVSHSQIGRRSSKEGWAKQRETQQNETLTLCLQKTAEIVSDTMADRVAQMTDAAALAARLLAAQLDRMEETGKVKTYEVKAITEALKNIRDLYKDNAGDRERDTMDKLDGLLEEMRKNAVDA